MKSTLPFVCVCSLIVVAALFSAGCTSFPGTANPVTPVSPGGALDSPGTSCGITSCHGLDLACGTNAPDVCTMEYRLGDKCRQYARCTTNGGSCTLVTDPQFETCKACVRQCESTAGGDSMTAFSCEAKC